MQLLKTSHNMIICTRTLGHVVRHVGAVCHVAGLGGLEVVGEEALAGGDGDGERVEAAVLLPAPAPANTRRPGHLERQSADYKVNHNQYCFVYVMDSRAQVYSRCRGRGRGRGWPGQARQGGRCRSGRGRGRRPPSPGSGLRT